MSRITEAVQYSIPELNEGEVYVGAVFTPEGRGHHAILLAGSRGLSTWKDALEWAASVGGDLPSRFELLMLYTHAKDQFESDWYWSNQSYEHNDAFAWCQDFGYGNQDLTHKGYSGCRARAVRRLVIE
ncbi:MAG: DUF1566 domain-containing protein [Paraburkholderia sp.]|uniref:DUF1566 domain-containing protein n=1 Tax=Paraburkholderia sp. TaxID=1926495 RepID=UPI003C637333